MSFSSSPLLANPFGAGAEFGLSVPQGDPGAVQGAARAVRETGAAVADQARVLTAAARVAGDADGSWRGSAAAAYAECTAHVTRVLLANGEVCQQVASALESFAHELAQAKRAIAQAISDCQEAQHNATTHETAAQQAAGTVESTSKALALAPHPAASAELHRQLADATRAQAQAQAAADDARDALSAAQRRGHAAADAYAAAVRSLSASLEHGAGALRPAPALPAAGVPVPISVSPSDRSLATTLLAAAGGLAGANRALEDSHGLSGVACGTRVSPGAALEYLQTVRNRDQLAAIARSDKPLDGSVAGVVPGPAGQVLQGGWNVLKGTGKLAADAWNHPDRIPGALSGYVQWAVTHPKDFGEQLIDWKDWSQGRPLQAVGELGTSVLLAKGAGEASSATGQLLRDDPATRPAAVQVTGQLLSHAGVPHASDAADLASHVADKSLTELAAGVHAGEQQMVQRLGNLLVGYRLTDKLSELATQLPSNPQIVVTRAPHPMVSQTAAGMVRRFPRGR